MISLFIFAPFFISFNDYQKTQLFLDSAIKTKGKVIGFELVSVKNTTKTGYYYTDENLAVIQFQTQKGNSIMFISNGDVDDYAKGDKTEVYYLASNPQGSVRLNSFLALRGYSLFTFLLGLLFIPVCWLFYFKKTNETE